MFKEFRDFAFKGNFLDLAIGVVIGAAFGAATSAFVVNLVNPLIGLLAGGQDFTNLFVTLKDGATAGPYTTLAAAQAAGAVTLNIGLFLNAIINLLLVAFVMFLVVKAYNSALAKEKAEEAAAPPEPSAEEKLLTEIRDLLAKGQ